MEEDMRRTAGPEVTARSKGITVNIEEHCMKDMQGWCDQTDSEVSGFGIVDIEDGNFFVRKVYLPLQYGSGGYTLIPGESRARLNAALDRRYQEQNPAPDLSDPANAEAALAHMDGSPSKRLKLWFHTHPTFNTFWSGTDDNEAQAQMEYHGDWSLSIVINHARDILARTDIMSPIKVMIDQLPIKIIDSTTKPPKRNYRKDVLKWVHPLAELRKPKKPEIITLKKEISSELNLDRYINYAGLTIKMCDFIALMKCRCVDDISCESCGDILKPYRKSYGNA